MVKSLAVKTYGINGFFINVVKATHLVYAFGNLNYIFIMQGQKVFFVLITLVFLFLVFWIYHCLPADRRFYPVYVTMMLLLSGAVGNFIDRIFRNYVVDFFYFELINFPIFNVADIYVTCAMALFIVLFLFYYKESDIDCLTALILPWKKHGVTKS